MFARVEPSITFDIYDCQQSNYPENIHEYEFFITTGSKFSVYENKTWIRKFIEFIQHLDRHQKKLIGICFGHQAIAMALDCLVQKSPKGWGVGVASTRILICPEWMKKTKTALNIIASHQDQVMQLTEQSQVIAYSDFCPYFMVQWNGHLLSIQGHPEFNSDYSRALMLERSNIIPAGRIQMGLESLSIEPDNELLTRWIIDFVNHRKTMT